MLFTNNPGLVRPRNTSLGLFSGEIKPKDYNGQEVNDMMHRFFKGKLNSRLEKMTDWYNDAVDDVPEGWEHLCWDDNDFYNKVVEIGEETEDMFQIVDGINLLNVDIRKVDIDNPKSLWEIHLLRRCFPEAKSVNELYAKARKHFAVVGWVGTVIIAVVALFFAAVLAKFLSFGELGIEALIGTAACFVLYPFAFAFMRERNRVALFMKKWKYGKADIIIDGVGSWRDI